jgi:H+-transporting ATPase
LIPNDKNGHKVNAEAGLTSDVASDRLNRDGPNSMPDTSVHPLRSALGKFWAPVPWLLEASLVLQVILHKYLEASIIGVLLVFNAALAYFQEGRAQATLNALKSTLSLNASARRDGNWKIIPASELVVGDLVKLSLGGVVGADVHLVSGSVLLDQSMLTGESLPVEAGPGADSFQGALVQRGEATATVTATGIKSKFGQTSELIRTAHVVSSQQTAVLKIVRNLSIFNAAVIVVMCVYSYFHGLSWGEIIPLLLTSVLAAIPVGLPATFTLATALGARALAKQGVLPTRLSAVDEAASIDVLCSDKTGTLTGNKLSVTAVHPMPGTDEALLLGLAALASSDGGEDSVDNAIRSSSSTHLTLNLPTLKAFVPFDPANKTSQATVVDSKGNVEVIIKGAFSVVSSRTNATSEASAIADGLEKQGFRVLAVAAGPAPSLQLIGFIALSDPPRSDSFTLISELRGLGVRTVMITGDSPATAEIVAQAVGLKGAVCPQGPIPHDVTPEKYDVYASILPEGKYNLVKAFQKSGHAVGMCGDGANDAPALRQAQIGIAVSSATDVAKSAAGVVLINAGLAGIVAAVKEGRITFQRILSYTLRSTVKKIAQVLLLAIGLLITGHAILTPMLMVIIMITGDFLAMSLTTDRVRPSASPNSWQIERITAAGAILGCFFLAFCTLTLIVGKFEMKLGMEQLRTLCVLALVYGSQATTYVIRERSRFWGLRPTLWLVLSSVIDILLVSFLAYSGIAMAKLPLPVLAVELGAAIAFGLILNLIKIPIFARLQIA